MYCYYELKVGRSGKFYFSNIETNQDEGLPALEAEGLVWKLSDEDSRKKPCDGFCTPPLPAYLVIKFKRKYYFIEYEKITALKESGDKSIDEESCEKLCTKLLTV
jgi:hypothetical protein